MLSYGSYCIKINLLELAVEIAWEGREELGRGKYGCVEKYALDQKEYAVKSINLSLSD